MNSGEHLIFSNSLGLITNKKIALKRSSEPKELPVENIEAIHLEKKKFPFLASASLTISAVLFIYVIFNFRYLSNTSILSMVFLSGFCFATFLFTLVGQHYIVLSTKDKKREMISVNLLNIRKGRLFVEMVRTVIV